MENTKRIVQNVEFFYWKTTVKVVVLNEHTGTGVTWLHKAGPFDDEATRREFEDMVFKLIECGRRDIKRKFRQLIEED